MHQTCRWSIAEDWYQSGRPGWFADPRFVPGGAFIDEGIYWIDFFRYLTGSDIVPVDARMANLVHKDIDVEPRVVLDPELDSGLRTGRTGRHSERAGESDYGDGDPHGRNEYHAGRRSAVLFRTSLHPGAGDQPLDLSRPDPSARRP